MECKYYHEFNLDWIVREVVIETLWNVNIENYNRFEDWTDVVIETLWNVNMDAWNTHNNIDKL